MKPHFLIILLITALTLIGDSLYAQEIGVVDHFDTDGEAYAVAVSENFIYVADGTNGLVVLTFDNEGNLEEADHFDTNGEAYGVTLFGDCIYVADGENGLIILESDEEGNIEMVNNFDTDGEAFSVIVDENYIYIADGENGIVVLAEDGNGNLIQVNQWAHPDDMADGVAYAGLMVEGDGYLADGENGFVILTAGDMGDIIVDRHWQHPENVEGEAFGVHVTDGRIFLADGQNGLVILTENNEGELAMDNHWPHPNDVDGEAIHVDALGDYIYVADAVNGLVILTEDNEGNLVIDNHWSHPEDVDGEAIGVTVVEDEDDVRIYLADGDNGLVVLMDVGVQSRELEVTFIRGWNMISINVTPLDEDLWEREEGPDVVLMLGQLRIDEENHHIELFKDELGRFYVPAWDFNNIPYWNLVEGYQAKVDEDVEAIWTGAPIPADADIPLNPNWNMIAYFPTYQLDASAPDFYVLSSIIDFVILAKNVHGQFLSPQFNFSNMPPWRETQGYQVKVEAEEPVVLNYPQEQEENAALVYVEPVGHWTAPVSTGENMSVLVTSISGVNVNEGDQIGAFDVNGFLVGTGMIDVDGRCGLTVWGDDVSTDVIDGLKEDEAFELRLWDTHSEVVTTLEVVTIHSGSGLVYETDGFVVLDVTAEQSIPESFYLANAYPNPFNSTTRLSYGLPVAAALSLRLYDVSGRHIATLVDEYVQAGIHTAVLQSDNLASGIYFVRVEALGEALTQKVLLVR